MKLNEMKEHIGKKVFVEYKGYNSLDGEYILSGLQQTLELNDANEKTWETKVCLRELPPSRCRYWLDAKLCEIAIVQEKTIREIQNETIKKIQAMQ